MTVSHTAPARYMGEKTIATSSPRGTILPRSGFFWGVRAPQHHPAVVIGEFSSSRANETQIRGWLESHANPVEQTSSVYLQTRLLRLSNFEIDPNVTSSGIYGDLTYSQFATGSYRRATALRFIRDVDVACAFVPQWNDPTESSWRRLREALAPLRTSSVAVLEAIRTELEKDEVNSDQSRHAGLAAVAWLTRVLELSRPTILRMGGVPESTFYAWRKNPEAIVRTPTISRLLRLQAQVGLLAEALGRDGLRAWLLSSDRLKQLQGDDTTFAQTLAEADEALTAATQIAPRPRMRLGDYESAAEQPVVNPVHDFPTWLGASKLPEEPAE